MMSTIIAQGHTEDSISRSTVSLLSLIASGEVFDYWKARIAQAPQNEYVVAKTVSGNPYILTTLHSCCITWFAK